MDTFKEKYSPEELKDISDWFSVRMDRLPSELVINESTKTDDLKKTIIRLLALARRPKLDVCFSGYIAHLFLIRRRLQEMGIE